MAHPLIWLGLGWLIGKSCSRAREREVVYYDRYDMEPEGGIVIPLKPQEGHHLTYECRAGDALNYLIDIGSDTEIYYAWKDDNQLKEYQDDIKKTKDKEVCLMRHFVKLYERNKSIYEVRNSGDMHLVFYNNYKEYIVHIDVKVW